MPKSRMISNSNGAMTPDLVVAIGTEGSSTMTNLDPTITSKPDWLHEFDYTVEKKLNPNVSNNSAYGSGQLIGYDARIVIYPTPASVYVENSLNQGQPIPAITIYRLEDMLGVLTAVEIWAFENVIFTSYKNLAETSQQGTGLANALEVTFQWQQLTHTLNSYNPQTLVAQGSVVSLINFSTGVLTPPAAGGGGAAPAATAPAAGG
ncbi:MAG: hypothetical protein KBD36_04445 [Alphaproteobacteria bacterium]|jgi:hypothetical protein|nr:hypothetical protein [Alphaproteobacteria bacterium]MBP9777074.1 hypothetical protein [Alphaproteobacteria bacterium]